MSLADLVLFRVDYSGSDHTRRVSHMDMSRLNLMANTSDSLSNSVVKDTTEVVSGEEDDSSCGDRDNEVRIVAVSVPGEEKSDEIPLMDMMTDDKTDWIATGDVITQESEDDSLSLEGDRFLESSCSLSVTSETSSLCAEDFLIVDANSEIETPRFLDVEKSVCSVEILAKAPEMEEVNVDREMTNGPLSVAVSLEEDIRNSLSSQSSAVAVQLPLGKQVGATVGRSVFEVEYVPLWGFTSLCGRRPEMEDAVAIVPQFLKIPIEMLVGGPTLDGISYVSQQTAHFFGVYDGHGGDRYLKPWIIPEPEVMFVPRTREDECLVLASDGLWDVMTNDEACDLARKRLLLWHKKNEVTHLPNRGEVMDPAAQAAAEYLSKYALQKGSKDNITMSVVDLNA